MESNVPKNTNSHKFFKISLEKAKLTISLRNLVKWWLLSIDGLYQQKFPTSSEPKGIFSAIDRKIILKNFQLRSLNNINHDLQLSFSGGLYPLVYACPLGLLIAADEQLPLDFVINNLELLLKETPNNLLAEQSELKFSLVIFDSGWLNIFLEPQLIALWLQQLISQVNHGWQGSILPNSSATQLLPIQYIHARCCSLLRLGAREKLIIDQQPDQAPLSLWLNNQQNLWLTELSEYNLIFQLLTVTDQFTDPTAHNWSKIALDLSQNTAIFLADCRFLGEVKQQSQQQAIARLGLIAIVQHWLQRILTEKLDLPAPTEF